MLEECGILTCEGLEHGLCKLAKLERLGVASLPNWEMIVEFFGKDGWSFVIGGEVECSWAMLEKKCGAVGVKAYRK